MTRSKTVENPAMASVSGVDGKVLGRCVCEESYGVGPKTYDRFASFMFLRVPPNF